MVPVFKRDFELRVSDLSTTRLRSVPLPHVPPQLPSVCLVFPGAVSVCEGQDCAVEKGQMSGFES